MLRTQKKSVDSQTIGFIGGGNMARALIGGLLADGFPESSIFVYDPVPEVLQGLQTDFELQATTSNTETVYHSTIVVLAVKPQVLRGVLEQASEAIQENQPLLISIAAGIQIEDIDAWSGGGLAVVRVMPNTPALIQQGMSAIFSNSRVSATQRQYAEQILSAVGKTVQLNQESDLDAVTAISGSGPAYFFYLIEALEQAARDLGLDTKTAHLLATQTAIGAGMLAAQSHEPAFILRQKVTSPGGTTEAAINVLENANVKKRWIEAVVAAQRRSIELSMN